MLRMLLLVLIIPKIGLVAHVGPQMEPVMARYDNRWLLAHNTQAGARFNELEVGDRLYFNHQVYVVTEIVRYQAIRPDDPTTPLRNLEDNITYSPRTVLRRVLCDGCLTLQTCIYREGIWTWGRLFIITKGVGE